MVQLKVCWYHKLTDKGLQTAAGGQKELLQYLKHLLWSIGQWEEIVEETSSNPCKGICFVSSLTAWIEQRFASFCFKGHDRTPRLVVFSHIHCLKWSHKSCTVGIVWFIMIIIAIIMHVVEFWRRDGFIHHFWCCCSSFSVETHRNPIKLYITSVPMLTTCMLIRCYFIAHVKLTVKHKPVMNIFSLKTKPVPVGLLAGLSTFTFTLLWGRRGTFCSAADS